MQDLKAHQLTAQQFAEKLGMIYRPDIDYLTTYYNHKREPIVFEEARKLSPLCWQYVSDKVFTQRRIVCAALRFPELDLIIPGARHYSADIHVLMDRLQALGVMPPKKQQAVGDNQGFLDNFGGYWNREDALVIARSAHQLDGKEKCGGERELFSEDLY